MQVGFGQGESERDRGKLLPRKLDLVLARREPADEQAVDAATGEDLREARGSHARFAEPEMLELVAELGRPRRGAREIVGPVVVRRAPAVTGRVVGDVGEHDMPRRAARAARAHEGGDERIGAITELVGDALDLGAHLRGDAVVVAQSEGDGGAVNSGLFGHVLEGRWGWHWGLGVRAERRRPGF